MRATLTRILGGLALVMLAVHRPQAARTAYRNLATLSPGEAERWASVVLYGGGIALLAALVVGVVGSHHATLLWLVAVVALALAGVVGLAAYTECCEVDQ